MQACKAAAARKAMWLLTHLLSQHRQCSQISSRSHSNQATATAQPTGDPPPPAGIAPAHSLSVGHHEFRNDVRPVSSTCKLSPMHSCARVATKSSGSCSQPSLSAAATRHVWFAFLAKLSACSRAGAILIPVRQWSEVRCRAQCGFLATRQQQRHALQSILWERAEGRANRLAQLPLMGACLHLLLRDLTNNQGHRGAYRFKGELLPVIAMQCWYQFASFLPMSFLSREALSLWPIEFC